MATEIMRNRTRLIVRPRRSLRQCAGRALAWCEPDTSYPKHGFVRRAARLPGSVFFPAKARRDRTGCAMRAGRTRVNALRRPVGSAVSAPFGSQVGRTLPHASAGHSRLSTERLPAACRHAHASTGGASSSRCGAGTAGSPSRHAAAHPVRTVMPAPTRSLACGTHAAFPGRHYARFSHSSMKDTS